MQRVLFHSVVFFIAVKLCSEHQIQITNYVKHYKRYKESEMQALAHLADEPNEGGFHFPE